ncbi:hypothetical protein A2U01_0052552, partial [Trifolium medium]|nr:hypothetical protein [Trifolium medium]
MLFSKTVNSEACARQTSQSLGIVAAHSLVVGLLTEVSKMERQNTKEAADKRSSRVGKGTMPPR